MEVVKKPLADRLNDVFGALGQGAKGTAPAWALRADPVPFKAGRAVTDNVQDDSDEEAGIGEQVMPQGMIDSEDMDVNEGGGEGKDSEDEDRDQEPKCSATAAFRRQFEQEEEEDEYDRFADGGWQGEGQVCRRGSRPPGSTEVMEDNVFDRMSDQRAANAKVIADTMTPTHFQLPASAATDSSHPTTVQPPRSFATTPTAHDNAPMEVDAPEPAGASSNKAAVAGGDDDLPDLEPTTNQQLPPPPPARKSVFDRLSRPSSSTQPLLPKAAAAAGASHLADPTSGIPRGGPGPDAGQDAHGGTGAGVGGRERQGKRVRFNDDVKKQDSSSRQWRQGKEDGLAQGLQRGFLNRGKGGGRGGRRPVLDWQRPGFVPDHVKHPERYTVYDLGEALTVGGGDQGSTSSVVGDAAVLRQAVASTQAAVAQVDGGGQEAPGGGAAEHDRAPLAVGAGAVTFRSKSQRQGDAGGDQSGVSVAKKSSSEAAAPRTQAVGAWAEDDMGVEEAGEQLGGSEPDAAGAQAAGSRGGRGGQGRRQFRSRAAGAADD